MLWALFLIFHGTHAEPIKLFDDYKVCSNLAEILSEAKEKKLIARADLDYICLPLPSEKLIAEVEENILFAEAKKVKLAK